MKKSEFGKLKSKKPGDPPGPAVQATPLQVKVKDDFEYAHKTFKHLVQREGVISKYKEYQSYEKPSEKKRRKRREAQEKRVSLAAKLKLMQSGEWEKRMKKKAKQKEKNYAR